MRRRMGIDTRRALDLDICSRRKGICCSVAKDDRIVLHESCIMA